MCWWNEIFAAATTAKSENSPKTVAAVVVAAINANEDGFGTGWFFTRHRFFVALSLYINFTLKINDGKYLIK